MTYQQTLNYLYTQLPMFQRIGSAAYKANLDNTIAICDLLKNPQHKFKSIHIAGTNGKGSTSHMLASILQSGGFKVGLYTSPHLKDFRERIRINGKMIPRKAVVDFVKKYKKDFEKIKPSFFEMTVGLAFNYFSEQKVDIAVIETGLGGRLDSTNVISPLLSIITNVSYDHQNLLGYSLNEIAEEKAGIIKPGIPVVIGETQKKVSGIFIAKAKSLGSPVFFADKNYRIESHYYSDNPLKLMLDVTSEKDNFKGVACGLLGLYQKKNAVTVFQAIDVLNDAGYTISKLDIRKGISLVVGQTGLQGRWQILSQKPLIITDTGHNEAGIEEVLKQIKLTPHKKLHFVLGMVNDKDVSTILQMLPVEAVYYFCKANIPRALDQQELAEIAKKYGLKGPVYSSVKRALAGAKKAALSGDLIFIGGSTFVVAEVI